VELPACLLRRCYRPRATLASSALIVFALTASCAPREAAHEKTLQECSTSGNAGRRLERRGGVDGYGGLSSVAVDLDQHEVTEIRENCVYTVKVRAGAKSWEVSGLSWVGEYAASPRGDRAAFIAQDRAGWHVVVDGALGPAFDGTIGRAKFSADGQHVMFVGHMDESGGHVFVDGEEVAHAPYGTDSGAFDFTRAGRYLVAIRTADGGVQVNAGGVLGPRLDTNANGPKIVSSVTALDLTASLSGDRFACVGTRAGRGVLVVDGREVQVPEGLLPKRPRFSASGARLLFSAVPPSGVDNEKHAPVVVIDGVVHRFPTLIGAAFAGGEIPLVTTAGRSRAGALVSETHVFGVERLDRSKPAGEPEDRIILGDRALDAGDLELRADGIVSYRGEPIAQLRGRRVPTVAE